MNNRKKDYATLKAQVHARLIAFTTVQQIQLIAVTSNIDEDDDMWCDVMRSEDVKLIEYLELAKFLLWATVNK